MGALGCVSDARIEAIAGIKAFVVILQRGLRIVQVTDIMFGRIFGAPLVEKLPDLMLDIHSVVALLYNVILMKHLAEEVTVIELVNNL
jgi:hypothetical protein